jgi:hypothetical protein
VAQLTLLQIIDAVTGELGLVQPSSVISAGDLQTIQLYNLLNREGDNLRRTHQWTALQSLFNLNVGAPIVTTGTVTNGSSTISSVSFSAGVPIAGIYVVTGSSIPVAARVTAVSTAAGTVTMDMVGTGTATATSITFGQDTYQGPTDYDFSINRTAWDRTNRWELLGPDSPQMDEWHRSGIVTTGPRRHFRWVGDVQPTGTGAFYNYRIWPPPQTIDTPFQLAWEYISLNWVESATGTGQTSFRADTDKPILDSQALILGTKWRFLQAKGSPVAASMQTEYMDYVSQLIARDGGAPTLSMRKRIYPLFITPANVQDGFWPGPTGPNTS